MLRSKKTEGSDETMYSVETNGLQMAGTPVCIEETQTQVPKIKNGGGDIFMKFPVWWALEEELLVQWAC